MEGSSVTSLVIALRRSCCLSVLFVVAFLLLIDKDSAPAAGPGIWNLPYSGLRLTMFGDYDRPSTIAFDRHRGELTLIASYARAHEIVRFRLNGVEVIAGTGLPGFSGDGGPASRAKLNCPSGLAIGPDHSIYFVENGNHRIRKISPDGTINTIAGASSPGGEGGYRDGRALESEFRSPEAIALTTKGDLIVADWGNCLVRKIFRGAGNDLMVKTIAGTASGQSYNLDWSRNATEMHLWGPTDVVEAPDQSILIADTANHRVLRLDPNGSIRTVAGLAVSNEHNGPMIGGFNGDSGEARLVRLNEPIGLAVTDDNGFLIADIGNNRICKVTSDGRLTTVVGQRAPEITPAGRSRFSIFASESQIKKPVSVLNIPGSGGAFLFSAKEGIRLIGHPRGDEKLIGLVMRTTAARRSHDYATVQSSVAALKAAAQTGLDSWYHHLRGFGGQQSLVDAFDHIREHTDTDNFFWTVSIRARAALALLTEQLGPLDQFVPPRPLKRYRDSDDESQATSRGRFEREPGR